jgi:RIO kinase 1
VLQKRRRKKEKASMASFTEKLLGNHIDGTTWKGRGQQACKEASSTRKIHTGRDDRATVEQVMDPRTRMILFKLLSTGFLEEIHGCISTGKEANVYYAKAGAAGMTALTKANEAQEGMATATDRQPSKEYDLAVKIFKTSILVFKDRDRYISGEHRFRHGYCKSNPRKMVKIWAEKEMRNLKRLTSCGVRCPVPILIKNNVLIMRFIGKGGWGAPRLRDANLDFKRLQSCYSQCIRMMRRMYQKAGLVHGDLSEYNMLYQKGLLYFIDVSQSVEHEHPRALDFLRMDCKNVTDYFRKTKSTEKKGEDGTAEKGKRLNPLTMMKLFTFITTTQISLETEDEINRYLEQLDNEMGNEEQTAKELSDEAVFMKTFIPRSLGEVHDFENEQNRVLDGDGEDVFVNSILNLQAGSTQEEEEEEADERGEKEELARRNGDSKQQHLVVGETKESGVARVTEHEADGGGGGGGGGGEDDDEEEEDNKDENENEEDEEDEEDVVIDKRLLPKKKKKQHHAGSPHFQIKETDDKAKRREHKRLVKLAKAEKRKTKIPKHLKKRATKKKQKV